MTETNPSDPQIIMNGDVVDLDAMAAAGRERAKKTYSISYLGKTWKVRNSVPFHQLVTSLSGDDMTLESALEAVAAFVVTDQRQDFIDAVMASDDVDIKELTLLSNVFNKKSQEEAGNDDT